MREIASTEVPKLRACLESLAEHHNTVSNNFRGNYPSRPYENTLKLFEEALINKTSRIAVAEEQGCIVGFCKIDICADSGRIDYIVILKEHRGKGCGKLLMDWAMRLFEEYDIHRIEVKAVDGNDDAIRLYEKYGFKINAHILMKGR